MPLGSPRQSSPGLRQHLDARLGFTMLIAAALVLVWYAWVVRPVQLAEAARARSLDAIGELRRPVTALDLGDEAAARRFLVEARGALPRIEQIEAVDAGRLRQALQRLQDALLLGTYTPHHLVGAQHELLALQRDLTRDVLARRGEVVEVGQIAAWSLYGLGGFVLLVLGYAQLERRRAASAVLGREELGQLLFAISPEAVSIADVEERIVAVNPAFCRVTGYDAREAIGRPMHFNGSGEQDEAFFARLRSELAQKGRWTGEIWQRRKTGEAYAERVTRVAIRDAGGRPAGFLTVSMDITANKDAERLINWQAHHDGLTKLPNRTLLLERLTHTLVQRRANAGGALLTLDLDRFKLVNETAGPPSGDRLLIEAAMRVAMTVAETDTVARLGSDEFAVLMPDARDDAEVERLSRRLLDRLREPFVLEGHEIFVTASIGAALFPQDGTEAAALVQASNTAMARAKESGGNTLVFYQRDMNARAGRRIEIESELRRALKDEQLLLLYQPIVDVRRGVVVAAEALMRWQHPQWGVVSPAEFIPVAEESGLILDMGLWLVAEVSRQVERLDGAGLDGIRLSLNISPRQLKRDQDMEDLLAAFGGARSERLTVEITESLLMHDAERVRRFMDTLHGCGARIALDDFGTGYSSLSYLRQFRFDALKVDRSFIREIERNATDLSLVAAIVSMGRILGADVIVEGVENEAQLRHLEGVGCELVQGFHFARPMPAGDLVAFVRGFA